MFTATPGPICVRSVFDYWGTCGQVMVWLCLLSPLAMAQEVSPAEQRGRVMEFHLRSQERTGLLVPLYLYPANIHTNDVYNRLIDLKRRYETVPMWVILNPASGPGQNVEANYTKAIDRLQGAGCVTLGYVSTSYAKRSAKDVQSDVLKWREQYPKIQGIFFDEMVYEDTAQGSEYQSRLNRFAREQGFWPTVANPGADTPGRYFEAQAADVIVIHEGNQWPTAERIHGNYFGGYSDYPPFTRCVLVHSMMTFDVQKLRMVRKYARWIYVTEDLYEPGKAGAENPWDTLSSHLQAICEELAR